MIIPGDHPPCDATLYLGNLNIELLLPTILLTFDACWVNILIYRYSLRHITRFPLFIQNYFFTFNLAVNG